MNLYLIEGTFPGEHFNIGFFNDEELARQHILKFLRSQNCEYIIRDGQYSTTYSDKNKCCFHFKISITKVRTNEIIIPHFVDK